MVRFAVIALFVTACVEAPDAHRKQTQTSIVNPTTSLTSTGLTTTGTDPDTMDCVFDPGGLIDTTELDISTEEDFTFDNVGRVLYQAGSAIVASSTKGATTVIAPGAPSDPSGLAMLSESELVIASPDTGSLEVLDILSGSIVTVAGGLDQPNGVATGWDGLVYLTERVAGRVIWVDPSTGQTGQIAEGLERPNGLALSHDENALYVATEDGIYALDRVDDDWLRNPPPRRVHVFDEATFVGTVAVDLCGFLYTVDYNSGIVLRIDPDRGDSVMLADLDAGASFGFGALHFGNGGAFPRATLYTSNRRVMTAIEVGIPGVLSPAAGY